MQILASYGVAFLVLGVLDGLWLVYVARDFYQREIGALLLSDVRKLPALLFYLGYPMGLVLLALTPRPDSLGMAVARSALLGLVAYGTYDLTNLATLKGWSLRVAMADTAWGAVVSAAAGAAVWWVGKRWA
jgi:uncharacterized membrane protein